LTALHGCGGWPKFSDDQMVFLRASGFNMTAIDQTTLFFERGQ
jgi:hypothetical protein